MARLTHHRPRLLAASLLIVTLTRDVAAAPPLRTYVHVAYSSGVAVASAEFLQAQWASVQTLLGPAGLAFAPQQAEVHPTMAAVLESREDRSALARFVVPHAVNVFVVESLADVDEAGRQRLGVHWRAGGTHYVIVATYAVPGGRPCPPQYTCKNDSGLLAHELGHFFGLAHDSRADNLMSYSRAGRAIWLDERQRTLMQGRLQQNLAKGWLDLAPQN